MWRVATVLLGALLATAAEAQTLVTGRVEYVDKAWEYSGWSGEDPVLPVRRADVHVLDGVTGAILASGSTADDGTFALNASLALVVSVKVRVDADTDLFGTFQRVRVTTESNVEYVLSSAVVPVLVPPPTLDMGTLTALPITSGNDEANAFNLLDLGVRAAEYLGSPEIGAPAASQTFRLYWPGDGGSYASGNEAHISEDDGYDDAVILHELGHVVHNLYSDSDSPGGSHTFGDSDQDPLLSFGEGYATFFGGAVQEWMGLEALYVDASGSGQSGGNQLHARLETAVPYAGDAYGACDELAVACTLFDLLDTELSADATPGIDDDLLVEGVLFAGVPAQTAWWEVFTGPVKSASSLNMNHAWDGWFSEYAADAHFDELQDVYDDRRMWFWADAQEPDNDVGSAAPLAAVTGSTWTLDRTIYWSAADPPAPGTGDQDWYAVPLVKGDVVDFATRYPGNAADADTQCDSYLEVYDPQGALVVGTDGGGTGANAKVTALTITQTGTWTCRVRTLNTVRRYGRYDIRAHYVFQNHPPVITDGPNAAPDSVSAQETAQLDVTATDQDAGQTLAFAWTPLDGGSILGSGAAVTFVPPAVTAPTVVSVQVVVSDSLGAEAPPAEVQITVTPAAGPCANGAAAVAGGTGKAGQLGVPQLGAQNLPVLPSTDFALHATDCLPLKPCTLVVGFTLISIGYDLGNLYPSPDLLLGLVTSPSGELLLPIALSADPLLCGLTVYVQLIVPGDPGAAGAKQTAQTGYLALTFGS